MDDFAATRACFPRGCRVREIAGLREGTVIGYGLLPRTITINVDGRGETITHADSWGRSPNCTILVLTPPAATK